MPRRSDRPDHRRSAIADEAARLMRDHGLTDYRDAKLKALDRLGLRNDGHLPSNSEVEAALAERNRIFGGEAHDEDLLAARSAALKAMRWLDEFRPRLTGAVLSGNATHHSRVELHLYADDPGAVAAALALRGVRCRSVDVRHRLRRGEPTAYPGLRFWLDEQEFAASILPERIRGQAPLSPVDGRPMKRAGEKEVARLVGGG